ncbi:sulfurtransferase [Algibacter mikhailovii]|uniref:Sulfurtransferase n=1 Tax=Algibacter mikhailovii TaxID=425498 RepID=A0A918QU12_9FLAO|nr:sulfurtransferase [Algibacter mikhailovii]GGZ68293.1 sulfurtransferase [Algibacter mikhailovii]
MITLSSPIVSAAWLNENKHAENLIILDGTINKSFNSEQIQIPNARLFDIKGKFSNVSDPFPSAFPSQNQFESEARALGINNASAIVVYDDKGIYSSARVWWLFKAFGFNNVAVLNGGFPIWKQEGFATERMSQYEGLKGDIIAELNPNYMRFFDDVKEASEAKTHVIIDARASGRFNCQVPEPRAGLRMGTIPNSVNLPFTDLLEDGLLKPKVALEKAFYMLADKDDPIVFSCGSGITACVLALGATIAGYKNISVYDGSWTEWGSLVNV